jgi:nonsense-mediated mRNA decay protein 3
MRRFCPRCGSEKGEFVGGLCVGCYWEGALEDIPRELRTTVCKHCYRHLHGKRWVQRIDIKGEDRIIEGAMAEAERQLELPEGLKITGIAGIVSARSEDGEPSAVELTVSLKESASGQVKEVKILVGIDHQLCHDCYCAATGKYDALVQVRAEGRRLDSLDKGTVEGVLSGFSVRSEERGKAEISQVKENEGGIDIRFTDLNPAKMFVRELSFVTGADVVESARIVGIDKRTGGRTYRTTIAVKLPELRVGDMLEIDGRIFRVSSFHRGRVVIQPLSEAGAQKSASDAQLEEARRVKGEDVRRVRMESVTEQFCTFLDLDGKRFFELPAVMVPFNMQPGEGGLLISVAGREYLVRAMPAGKNP